MGKKPDRKLRIVQVSMADVGGGAARVAQVLHRAYLEMGHHSLLVVGTKLSDLPGVLKIDNSKRKSLRNLPRVLAEKLLGRQYLAHPGSHRIGRMTGPADVFHLHNLHGGYFDPAALPALGHTAPTIAMMHDNWLQTGHCGYHLECDKWRTGCGSCPHLDSPPGIRHDGTVFNWRRKERLFAESRLWITAPSDWLIEEAGQSPLLSRFPSKMIRNGVDLNVFSPGDQEEVRKRLGLPVDRKIVLFLAHLGLKRKSYKDPGTVVAALRTLASTMGEQCPLLLAIGADGQVPAEWADLSDSIRCFPFSIKETEIADFYRACDLFLHVTRADNCPLTILEAMACGKPVIATSVGGVPELVQEGKTGKLVPQNDAGALASAVQCYLNDRELLKGHGAAGRKVAEEEFDIRQQVQAYLDWYIELIDADETGERTQ